MNADVRLRLVFGGGDSASEPPPHPYVLSARTAVTSRLLNK
jgi:hypothetical protein